MKKQKYFIFLGFILFMSLSISHAKDPTSGEVVMQRLVRENWFENIETLDDKFVSIKPGDTLYLGIQELLSGVLKNKILGGTTFSRGDSNRSMVEINHLAETDDITFRFRRDLRDYEMTNSLIPRLGGLVSACYFSGVENDLDSIKMLRNKSILTTDEALILLLHYDYLSIKFTYDFYEKFAIPWSKSCNVDPVLWKANMSLPYFLESKRGQMSKKRWHDWLEE